MTEPRYPAQVYSNGQGDPVPRHRRNPRRAYDREGREIATMDLANAAENGVRRICAICPPPCRPNVEVDLDRFLATMAVRDVGAYLRCSVRAERAGNVAGMATKMIFMAARKKHERAV